MLNIFLIFREEDVNVKQGGNMKQLLSAYLLAQSVFTKVNLTNGISLIAISLSIGTACFIYGVTGLSLFTQF